MQLNNEKNRQIKGKITKSSITFSENKPNSQNNKIGVSSFGASKYEILTAWRGKKQTQFKPNQTQFKANLRKAKNEPKKCYNNELQRFCPGGAKKSNPIQTQNKPNAANLSPRDNKSSIYPRGIIDVPLCSYALVFLGLLPRFLRHYSLDYFVRWSVEYLFRMSRVNKPTKPCYKEELKCRPITPAQNPVVPSCLIADAS